MPGIVKIGFSTKDPLLRANELQGTGNPEPFVVEYDVLVIDPREVEQQVHRKLSHCHYSKEFFKIGLNDAIDAIKKVIVEQGKTPLHETIIDNALKSRMEVTSKATPSIIKCSWPRCNLSTLKGASEHWNEHLCQLCKKPLTAFSKSAYCDEHVCQWISGCVRARQQGSKVAIIVRCIINNGSGERKKMIVNEKDHISGTRASCNLRNV